MVNQISCVIVFTKVNCRVIPKKEKMVNYFSPLMKDAKKSFYIFRAYKSTDYFFIEVLKIIAKTLVFLNFLPYI